ncbi:N-acetyl-gamma-glutamyl-phosphate reductase [Lederbergia lenta]|uniref:N-acetyl-gamma-glutamyl-phosphate reductase n=1 Tax=Lederbergia lenta TaxID=1467 RepID=A0A2X4ZGA3_LEDLE|nr:N-acetyl-gamma-glutamyl-phosphate reductase [Lederbergia lenta]MCM3109694.1 N-acetyl-gamma-glutamyl-phosphate reductase [Lederbergia lenta]MEC2324555.1 N-acetyl-gamma-glutamyl-phosphate reductase [Lederbergia lenta]SQI59484.1 N-acetyl-gamma-glutamyl-phosphate reductase [Lederbergia lenta]
MKAGVVGATGYGGAELLRILHTHPYIKVTSIYSSSKNGENITEHYPHLQTNFPLKLEEINPSKMAQQTDIVFLAVPTGIASTLAPQLLEAGCTVVDLSGDFRLEKSDEYENWYKKKAAPKEWVDQAVYCIPELNRKVLKDTKFISNPGCYPTASLLGLAPLAKAQLIKEDSIIIDAKSGVSGAGQAANFDTIYNELNENLKIYKVNQHQHIPEIEQMLQQWGFTSPITFHTHLVPMTRGIMATIYVSLNETLSEDQLFQLYREFYENEAFVRLRDPGKFPATKEVAGSNYCDIGLSIDKRTGRVTIVSVIDNLMKGAAGQAIQNANILLGFEETTGLSFSPIYP